MSDGFRRVPTIFSKSKKSSLNALKLTKPVFSPKLVRTKDSFAGLSDDESIEKKVDRLFDTQDLLFERLDSEPKLSVAMKKSLGTIKHSSKTSARYIHKQPLATKVVAIVAILLLSGGVSYLSGATNPRRDPVSEVAGVQSSSERDNLPATTTQPSFTVITPAGRDIEGVEREAPSKDKIYSYPDELGGIRIVVTQQKRPESFSRESDAKLAEFAKANYLSGSIQVDNSTVYYGSNEKTGIQSFVFLRSDNLVFIQADQTISDDLMAAYIVSLQEN